MPKLTPDTDDIKPIVNSLRSSIKMLPYILSLTLGVLLAFFGVLSFLREYSTGLPLLGGLIGFFAGITIGGLLSSPMSAVLAWMIHVLFLLKRLDAKRPASTTDQND
ncbi:MAG: hypothetical protein JNK90_01285 [Planctomycetaceae bacterium]|nr:hypothetical protein [Planctomycetaceae bacterium]